MNFAHRAPALPRLLDLYEVADILGCHYETARLMCKRGQLPYVKRPGCSIRVSETDLAECIEWANKVLGR